MFVFFIQKPQWNHWVRNVFGRSFLSFHHRGINTWKIKCIHIQNKVEDLNKNTPSKTLTHIQKHNKIVHFFLWFSMKSLYRKKKKKNCNGIAIECRNSFFFLSWYVFVLFCDVDSKTTKKKWRRIDTSKKFWMGGIASDWTVRFHTVIILFAKRKKKDSKYLWSLYVSS